VDVPVRVVRTVADLEPGTSLLLIDLDAQGAVDAIERCRRMVPTPRIVAFGPHVREDLLTEAREAGADEVLPRSAFVARLSELLLRAD
jgi:DNA-binding NarL/FixJ family response regulator